MIPHPAPAGAEQPGPAEADLGDEEPGAAQKAPPHAYFSSSLIWVLISPIAAGADFSPAQTRA
jgi:hypothetical protein